MVFISLLGELADLLSSSDLNYFTLDETILLTALSAGSTSFLAPESSIKKLICFNPTE